MNKEPGKGEVAVFLLAEMFHTHAGKDGDKDHLSKKEAKELLEEEFPLLIGVSVLQRAKVQSLHFTV